MTGGLGFSRQGQDSFRSNRELRKARKTMGENPYVASETGKGRESIANYDELRQWKEQKDKSRNRLRRFVFIAVVILTILMVVFVTVEF